MVTRAESAIRRVEAYLSQMGFVPMTEAARMAGIPLATLSDAIRAGSIPAVKFGKYRLVRVEGVRQHFARQTANGDDWNEQEMLVARGLLVEARQPGQYVFTPPKRALVTGQPVSRSIVEERR